MRVLLKNSMLAALFIGLSMCAPMDILPMAFGQGKTALDADYGFLNVRLGVPPDSVPDIIASGSFEKKSRYVPRKLPKEISGGIAVTAIEYLFWEGALHSIRIRTEGNPATERLRELLEIYYGDYSQRGFETYFTWEGNRVVLTMDENLITHNAWTTFTSKEIDSKFSRVWRRD